ncbi:MAG: ATP-binding protein [Acidobacteriota bacterium]|nr:ATP-binding protein [Acidobacteriota bacterium]
MLQELKFQLSTAILTVLTIAAAIAAALNYQQIHRFRLPDDGVTWGERPGSGTIQVVALRVARNGPADRAGIRVNDLLKSIQGAPIGDASDVPRRLAYVGAWAKAAYVVRRASSPGGLIVDVPASVIVSEAARGFAITWQYVVGVAYLAIGLFVYFRRGSAYKARHFYIFCLASFIFSCFHRTGKLNAFDQVIDWGNLIAGWLAPALFLHFCLTFPEPRAWFRRRRGWLTPAPALYLPGAIFTLMAAGFASGVLISPGHSSLEIREILDRAWMGLLAATYLLSGLVLQLGCRAADDPVIRQQLKWLRNGMLFGFLPFAAVNAIPFVLDVPFQPWMNYAVVTLPLIPLTIAIAIVRYRLMDVDVIFRRGYAYTMATLVVLAAFYGLVLSLGSLVQKNFKDLGNTWVITVMLIATFLFQPLRNWIQDRLDRYFYRDRYDYRRTLVEFARELNSETDLDHMLQSVSDRLMQTLSIRHVAFFLADHSGWRISLDSSALPLHSPGSLDLSFLDWPRTGPYLFFERTRYHLDAIAGSWPPGVRQTIAELDLNYFVPCTVRGRTIAYFGVSRTDKGEYLSSDDLELLQTLSNYVGIAAENANLYRSLKQKVDEYERLKEFSENIVESINVGILAAGLDDTVESWNTQMERLSGIGRADAVGRTLAELFPAGLVGHFERVRGEMRIHHLDKFLLDTRTGESSVNIAIAPLVSRDNERIGRLVIFDDVTDRAELERRLVQADKLSSIGLLAAGVAHEVNTPLAVISTYAQMLAKQVADDEQKSRMLEKIARQTFRASEIVNSLLNFSRTATSELTEVQLNKVIEETLSLLEHELKKAGIETRVKLDGRLDPVKGNSGKLQQVFLNLFLNARDAMEQAGRSPRRILEVTTSCGENGAIVEVTDSGHGIAPEHLSRIYDPFFTTKSAKKGTGLGLSVTYGIIQEHGGAIEAVSRPGEGTCFHLEFPAIVKAVPV